MRFLVVLVCSVWFSLDVGLAVGPFDDLRRGVSTIRGHLASLTDKGFLKLRGKLGTAVMSCAVITMLASAGCNYELLRRLNGHSHLRGHYAEDITRKGVRWHGNRITKDGIIPNYRYSTFPRFYYGISTINNNKKFYDRFNSGKMNAHDYHNVVVIYRDKGRYFIGLALRIDDGSKDLVEIKHLKIDDTPDKIINVDKVLGVMITGYAHGGVNARVEVQADDLLPVGDMEIPDNNDDMLFYGQTRIYLTGGGMLTHFTGQISSEGFQELNESFWALAHVNDLMWTSGISPLDTGSR